MPILRPHAALFHERRISSVTLTSAHLYYNVCMRMGVARALADSFDFGLLGEQGLQKMGDSLFWTPMNRLAIYDAAIFILDGEIRNRTNTQTHTHKQTNKQTVTDISTPCVSACMDNKREQLCP